MKRLSLEELKAQSSQNAIKNLETIKGGDFDWCHFLSMLKQAFRDLADKEDLGPANHDLR